MRKTLQDVAGYLKEIMVAETREKYVIKTVYTNISDEENIREGILAFRAFLARIYGVLLITGDKYDNCKKNAHEYENRITLSVNYPFLHNVSIMLMKIGYYGNMVNDHTIICNGDVIYNNKVSVAKNFECLKFLAECGIGMEGVDVNDKKQNLSDIKDIKITYSDAPDMMIGLKVMAIAEIDYGTLVNQDIFLRCDYRILKKEETDVLSIVKDTIKALPTDVQEFILQLHQRYLKQGLTCVVEIKGFHIYIKYGYKRKDVWGINASLRNGYHINVKPTRMDEYADTINKFSPVLQELIAKGYGCGRKREIGHCDGGCRGLTIPLNDSFLDLRNDIEAWFDCESTCLQKK